MTSRIPAVDPRGQTFMWAARPCRATTTTRGVFRPPETLNLAALTDLLDEFDLASPPALVEE